MNSPQPSSDLQQFVDSINKTGFVLENRVVSILRKHGWAVLNNRHYVDDTSAVVREIDIIAYKTAKLEFVTVYTSLVLSCKKSEGNSWALLSRDLPAADVNRNRQPLHAWSNDVPISYMLAADEFAPNFYSTTCVAGTGPLFRPKDYELFAFQEMAESSGAVRNDKAIYQAVTSLMKAQAYEVQSLPRRKKTPSVYQFNLVSVLDGQMVRLHFDELAVTANRTHDEIPGRHKLDILDILPVQTQAQRQPRARQRRRIVRSERLPRGAIQRIPPSDQSRSDGRPRDP